MLERLDTAKTRELEEVTTPIEIVIGYPNDLIHPMLGVTGWYRTHGLTTKDSIYKHNEKIAECLGFKPNYYVSYEYRNAVWGLRLGEMEFIVYNSKRGFHIQVKHKTSKQDAQAILSCLKDKLVLTKEV